MRTVHKQAHQHDLRVTVWTSGYKLRQIGDLSHLHVFSTLQRWGFNIIEYHVISYFVSIILVISKGYLIV